jgi:cation:H+ antiporter
VVGSNICNIALILGFATLLRPPRVEAKVVRLDVPLMILSSLVLLGMLADGDVSRSEGILLLVGLLAYVCCTFWQARRESEAGRQALRAATPAVPARLVPEILMVVVGSAVLVGGGRLLVDASIDLAAGFGVSQAVIGLTIVAVGTSLPEMATSIVASIEGQGDIAVGNVVGSNIFNILGILGVTATTAPLSRGAIGWSSLAVMLLVSVALIPLFSRRLQLSRWGGGMLLAGYAGYVTWLLVG